MNDEIQVGDLVECIDGIPGSEIETGKTYRVHQADYGFIFVSQRGNPPTGGWLRSRFRKVEPPLVTSWTPKPEVLCSGPYVARSEYERVCAELKALKAAKPATPVDVPPLHLIPDDIRCVGWLTIDADGQVCLFLQKPHISNACGVWTTCSTICNDIGTVKSPNDWKSCIWRINTLGQNPVVIEDEA